MAYYISKTNRDTVYDDLAKNITYLMITNRDRYEVTHFDDDVPLYEFYNIITKKVKVMAVTWPIYMENFREITESAYQEKVKQWEALQGEEERYDFSSAADEIGRIRAAEIDADNAY